MPPGSDNMKLECYGDPEARRDSGGHPKPRWFTLTLRICLDKSASIMESGRPRRHLILSWIDGSLGVPFQARKPCGFDTRRR